MSDISFRTLSECCARSAVHFDPISARQDFRRIYWIDILPTGEVVCAVIKPKIRIGRLRTIALLSKKISSCSDELEHSMHRRQTWERADRGVPVALMPRTMRCSEASRKFVTVDGDTVSSTQIRASLKKAIRNLYYRSLGRRQVQENQCQHEGRNLRRHQRTVARTSGDAGGGGHRSFQRVAAPYGEQGSAAATRHHR